MSIHKASIDVVAAVIMKNDLFLIANRSLKIIPRGYGSFQGEKSKKTRLSLLL